MGWSIVPSDQQLSPDPENTMARVWSEGLVGTGGSLGQTSPQVLGAHLTPCPGGDALCGVRAVET